MQFRHTLVALSALTASALAAPTLDERQLLPTPPTVTIRNGTIIGSSSNGIDTFKGIPFAAPPVGPLRLKPPTPLKTSYGVLTATSTPTSCPQMSTYYNTSTVPGQLQFAFNYGPLAPSLGPQGEDCLTLNIQRPSKISKPLPVLFWIYGGGFEFGSTSTYDGSPIVSKSMSLGGDVIYVAVNYRVSGFGFLASKELQADHSTNLGLRDQRLAMQWVQENIAAFGGDPNRVTIWGESAGSISVFDHLLINNGDHTYNGKPLFIGAIMDSGSAVPTSPVNAAKPQAIYNQVVSAAGCSGQADTLACLRSVPYATIQNAFNSVPGIGSYQSLDLSYLPRYDPSDNFFSRSPDQAAPSGMYAKVPIIIGDQEDEGTLFAQTISNVTSTALLVQYLQSYFPDAPQSVVQGLVNLYPTDPAAGSPFNTGSLNEIYPGYKRNAALLGDITFTLTRRVTLQVVKQYQPTLAMWSYLGSYFSGTPVLGTFHATDIIETYFGLPYASVQSSILTYYLSFVNYQQPNAYLSSSTSLITWPQWTATNPQLLHFTQTSNSLLADNFRSAVADYLRTNAQYFHV